MAIVVEEFRRIRRGSLTGFALVHMTGVHMRLHDVGIYEADGKRWASPASRPWLDRTGRQQSGTNGKPLWQPVISFDSRAARDQWSDRVVAALLMAFPGAFAAEAAA